MKIKNPVLRWLAGCVVTAVIAGLVGVALWVIGWLARLVPGYYAWVYIKRTLDIPFDLVLLGFVTALFIVIFAAVVAGVLYVTISLGNRYFRP